MKSNDVKVKVRGIYTTALTKLLSQYFTIVQMSKVSSTRFNENIRYDYADVLIKDRLDRQGVILLGSAIEVDKIVNVLQKNLPDMITREKFLPRWSGYTLINAEFPGQSKRILDIIRSACAPTVRGHHKFRIFASHLVNQAEKKLGCSLENRSEIEKELSSLITFNVGEKIKIEHVKLSGAIFPLNGEISEVEDSCLKVKRIFRGGGVYDGLKTPKDEGDYALTEIRENANIVKHDYYSANGKLKGTYYNINTPIEFYPGKVRYVDLEVDIVKEQTGQVRIVDIELLEKYARDGFISYTLASWVKNFAEDLMRRLSQ